MKRYLFGLLGVMVFASAYAAPAGKDAHVRRFGFDDVVARAREEAQKPYQEVSENATPEFLRTIGYDQWRDFRSKRDTALWAKEKLPFQVQFFHPGFLFNRPVIINAVEPSGVHAVPFSQDYFDYTKVQLKDKIPQVLHFAGFRIHCQINQPDYYDEVVVFLGASYFRVVAKGERYGLSSRGLAINTAGENGEEFPFFKEFWLVKPGKGARELTVYALLDSPSVCGAYEFVIKPGQQTTMNVTNVVFARGKVRKLGLAPLTSMFYSGENERHCDDFRPEVHDSDGLSMVFASGEWIWRPLINPQRLFINTFVTDGIKGFGLMQRDMTYDSYLDLEARFDLHPSLWIEPRKGWGAGRVELVQIPSPNEYNDNMVAYWVPEKELNPGDSAAFSYVMKWGPANLSYPPAGYAASTRMMTMPGTDTLKFVIEFEGKELLDLPAHAAFDAEVAVGSGYTLVEKVLYKNSVTGAWRLVFQIKPDRSVLEKLLPDKHQAVELRAFLKLGPRIMTETWSYAVEI